MTKHATIVHAGGGTPVRAFGSEILFALSSDQTFGALSLGLAEVPAGHGPPLHVHNADDELFLILDGEYSFFVEGEWRDASKGSVVFLPRGSEHTFKVVSSTPGRHWALTTPGGFDRFYSRCAEVFAQAGPPDGARIGVIAGEHGLQFLPPPSDARG